MAKELSMSYFMPHAKSSSFLTLGLATILGLFLGVSGVFANDPSGQGGSIPPGPPVPPSIEQPRSGIGVLAASNFGTLNADNTCLGSSATGFCDSSHLASEDLEVMD